MKARERKQHKRLMKKQCVTPKARNLDYPKKSNGSEIAGQLRKKANALSEEEREECFREGMQIIYGGSGTKQKVRP